MKSSSGRDVARVTANLEHWEQVRITYFSEKASDKNNTFHELIVNNETRGYISR